jgi:hypothetical protein
MDKDRASFRSLSRHSLHATSSRPPGLESRPIPRGAASPADSDSTFQIPLTTVSEAGNFDTYVNVSFSGPSSCPSFPLLLDSGNSMLIMPDYDQIEGPDYQVLLTGVREPWGCPANVVIGPIMLLAAGGLSFVETTGCVFYACTGPNTSGFRTANFGLGCIQPWTSNGWNQPPGLDTPMQSPLTYFNWPYAEVTMAPASSMFAMDGSQLVNSDSQLTIYNTLPPGYTTLNIIPNLEWMSVYALGLSIDNTGTGWPGSQSAVAFVDTGGGPVFLSDPNGYVYDKTWPDPVSCPTWTSGSKNCECVASDIGIMLGDGVNTYGYNIIQGDLPPSVQGLAAVLCEQNAFMMGQYGMNIGGISMLANRLLIDYANAQVGFSPVSMQS